MYNKSIILTFIISLVPSGTTEKTFNYPPLVALDTNDANGIQIFKRHIISKEGLWSWSSWTWLSSKTMCQFYKNTIKENHFYLMLIDNPKQWQIFENLSEGKYGCPSSDKNKLLFYNHLGGDILKSEGWLDYRKRNFYSNKQSINVHELNNCSAYTKDAKENEQCTNKNPNHCEIVLRDTPPEVINKCFPSNQRSSRDLKHDVEYAETDNNPGFPYVVITGCIVGGILVMFAVIYLLLGERRSESDPGPEYNENNFHKGENIENHQNIFVKGEDLKINVVHSTEDERNRLEEFQKLETKVAHYITPFKSTKTSQKGKNAKHNRYRDIGKYIFLYFRNLD